MDADALRLAVEQSRFAAVGVAFLAGLLFSVNPVAIAAIPVSLAYVIGIEPISALHRPAQGRKTTEGKALNTTAAVAMAIAPRAKR